MLQLSSVCRKKFPGLSVMTGIVGGPGGRRIFENYEIISWENCKNWSIFQKIKTSFVQDFARFDEKPNWLGIL